MAQEKNNYTVVVPVSKDDETAFKTNLNEQGASNKGGRYTAGEAFRAFMKKFNAEPSETIKYIGL